MEAKSKALVWDEVGKRFYETGVDHGVLYVFSEGKYGEGVAWNGLTNVTESPSGAEESPFYADNIKYLSLRSAEELGGTIECYSYPDEWMGCDGSTEAEKGVIIGQQTRKKFGLCYRTKIGNDEMNDDYGYKLHLIYNASASPSERAYASINDSPEPITMSYEYTTTPVAVTGHKPTSIITIDSTKANKEKLTALEKVLYGDAQTAPRLPDPDEVITMMKEGE